MSATPNVKGATVFDRILATAAAVGVFGLVGYLLIRGKPIDDPGLFFALRLMLSFSTAALGATLPGFLNVNWKGNGIAVRAGGALALFLLTYVYTPLGPRFDHADQPATAIDQKSGDGGINSVNNSGTINGGSAK